MSEKDDTDLIASLAALKGPVPGRDLMGRIARDADLEQAFAEARRAPPQPSDLLMERIVRDARSEVPRRMSDLAAWGAVIAAGLVGLTIGLWDGSADLQTALLGEASDAVDTLVLAYDFQYSGLE